MNDPFLRPATTGDAEAIAALINAAFRVEQFFIDGDRTNPERVRALLQTGAFLLAEIDNQLTGCVYVELRDERGYFGLLAVRPERQKSGLGARLVAAAENHCRTAGCRVMDMQLVNLRAELPRFYQRLGYQEIGTAPFIADNQPKLPCHFVLMSKAL